MSEAEDVARSMIMRVPRNATLAQCREIARQQLCDETVTVIDNVAWALWESSK